MSRRNILIALGVILLGGALVAANLWYKKETGLTVTTEVVKTRDLEAVVSASGKIQPKRLVKISAETSGRVVDLAVNEGDRIKKGQFLLQIDPKTLRTRVDSGEASLQVAAAVARADAAVDRNGARSIGTAARSTGADETESETAAGPVVPSADDAREPSKRRRTTSRGRRPTSRPPSPGCRSARRRPRRRTAGSCRSARRSKTRATI